MVAKSHDTKSLKSRLPQYNFTFIAASTLIILIIIIAIIGEKVTNYDPMATDPMNVLADGSREHWLGTDASGRDIWSRLIAGARVTLMSAVIPPLLALTIGMPFGVLSGYFGGWLDRLFSWFSDVLQAAPNIVVAIAFSAALRPPFWAILLLFGVLFAPGPYRLARTGTLSVVPETYINAAKTLGLSDVRIMSKHVGLRIRKSLIIQASMAAGVSATLMAGLDFLGVGDPTLISWGGMLNDSFQNIYVAPIQMLWPGIALAGVSASFAIWGTAFGEKSPSTRISRNAHVTSKKLATNGSESEDRFNSLSIVESQRPEILRVKDLEVTFPMELSDRPAVQGVSFNILEGEKIGIVGESGSGKSQTAFAILGLLHKDATVTNGSVTAFGKIGNVGSKRKNKTKISPSNIGYIPQEPLSNLDPSFTIGNQLLTPMKRNLKISKQEARSRVLELFRQFGLKDPERILKSYPFQISGGMAQRVLIAGAIAMEPRLLVADEPTTALDVTTQASILELLRTLTESRAMSLVIVTHDLGVVADLTDRVLVMCEGVFVESAETEMLLSKPKHPYTESLLAASLENAPLRSQLKEDSK